MEWFHCLFLFPHVLGENVVVTCKIRSFLSSLDILLQKDVIIFCFWKSNFKMALIFKKGYFDLLFTFFAQKLQKVPSARRPISLTYVHVFLLTLLTFLPYQLWNKYEFIRYGFSLVWFLVLLLIRAILEQSINNKIVSKT